MLGAAYTKGRVDALARFGVKVAAVPLARPFPIGTPHPAMPAPAVHAAPAATPHPTAHPGYQLTPGEEAQAQQLRGMSHTQRQEALGLNEHMPPPAAPAAAPAAAGPSRMQQFMRPIKRGLGLAALGGAGALAYGLHQQNKQDQDARDLVYAPLQGAY